eukprot:jgi/Undpi1/6766/HiC_scaffold_21.g09245.m1
MEFLLVTKKPTNIEDDNNDVNTAKNAPTATASPANAATTTAAQATAAATARIAAGITGKVAESHGAEATAAAIDGITRGIVDGSTTISAAEATAAATDGITGGATDGNTDNRGSVGAATAVGTAVVSDEVEDNIRAVMSGAASLGGDSPKHGGGRETAAAQAEVLRVLDFLFCSDRALVESTIQVLDKSRVVNVRARDSGRGVWLVQGSRGAPYLCLGSYCSCRSFLELARRGGDHPVLCKHLLAVRLAPVLGVSRVEEVDDDKLAQRISACDYG